MPIISGGGGGGSGATVLFSSVLAAPAASIDTGANGVAGGFNILEIFILARSATAVTVENCIVRFNNDSGANYDNNQNAGVNATPTGSSAAAATSVNNGFIHGASSDANYVGICHMVIPGYALTTFNKVGNLLSSAYDSTLQRTEGAGFGWRNTAAISRVSVASIGGGNLATGSAMWIYGR